MRIHPAISARPSRKPATPHAHTLSAPAPLARYSFSDGPLPAKPESETLCRCDALWLVEKSRLSRKRGSVAPIRRRQIVDKINASMGWKLV